MEATVVKLGEGGGLAVRELLRDNEDECRRVLGPAARLGVAWSRVERSISGMGEWLHWQANCSYH